MKGYILLYAWLASWILMLAGLGTMEWAMETGDDCFGKGLLLFLTWPVMSYLAIKNEKEVDRAMNSLEDCLTRLLNR